MNKRVRQVVTATRGSIVGEYFPLDHADYSKTVGRGEDETRRRQEVTIQLMITATLWHPENAEACRS